MFPQCVHISLRRMSITTPRICITGQIIARPPSSSSVPTVNHTGGLAKGTTFKACVSARLCVCVCAGERARVYINAPRFSALSEGDKWEWERGEGRQHGGRFSRISEQESRGHRRRAPPHLLQLAATSILVDVRRVSRRY